MFPLLSAGISPVRTGSLFLLLIVTAFLVGSFNPRRRRKLRHVALLSVGYLFALALGWGIHACGFPLYAARILWVAEVLEVLVFVQLAVLLVLHFLLWKIGVAVVEIVADLAVGGGYALVLVQTMARAGLSLSGILTTSAVVSGVVGLALAPTLTNVLGGIALQLEMSLRVGDWLRIDGADVQVRAIRWRHTVLQTLDSDTWIVPNTALLGSTLKLHGRSRGRPVPRRYQVHFHVSLEHPVDRVLAIVNEAMQRSPIPYVASSPEPHALCADLARPTEVGVASYFVRYWLTDITMDDLTHSQVRARIDTALRRAGVSLAKPEQRLRLRRYAGGPEQALDPSELSKRVALLRALSLFEGFEEEELQAVALDMLRTTYASGENIVVQGHEDESLCLLRSGEVEVRVSVSGRPEEKVRRLIAPDFFGERALVSGQHRAASVVAARPSEVYRLPREAFQSIVLQRPSVLSVLSSVIANRDTELRAVRESQGVEPEAASLEARRTRILRQLERFFGLDAGKAG